MSKQRMMRLFSLLFAFSLVAAACGGGSDDASAGSDDTSAEETDAGGQEAGGVDEEAADAALSGADDGADDAMEEEEDAGPEPQNIEELEAAWAENRASVVEMIKAEGYGVNADNVLVGPGGFEIDLNDCPADWSDTEGIGDSILIGQTTALSGNLAAYGNINFGMEAYFDYVNANGGIAGLPIELIIKDDAYVATKTIELVDELLQ